MVAALRGKQHFLGVGLAVGLDGGCAVNRLVSGSWAKVGIGCGSGGLAMGEAEIGGAETHFAVVGNNFINAN